MVGRLSTMVDMPEVPPGFSVFRDPVSDAVRIQRDADGMGFWILSKDIAAGKLVTRFEQGMHDWLSGP